MSSWYEISNPEDVSSPAILLYPARIEQNLQQMIATAGDVGRLRPHVKTHKLPQIIALKRKAGISKFKASTIAEAEMAAGAGAEDLLLAYQPVGPNIARLIELIRRFPQTRFSALVDDADNLARIGKAAAASGVVIELLVDLNIGMNRTGIAPGDEAAALYRSLCATPSLKAAGLHAYDGHLHSNDQQALSQAVESAFAPVWQLREQLLSDSLPVPATIASGSPTFALLARHDDVELGAGTTVLSDVHHEQDAPAHAFVPAAVLLARVVSKPQPDLLCLDLGHKAVASEMPLPRVRLFGLEDAQALTHSEEHLVVRSARAAQYQVGDVVYGIPYHICPTMALHSEVWAAQDGRAVERWPVVARARRISV